MKIARCRSLSFFFLLLTIVNWNNTSNSNRHSLLCLVCLEWIQTSCFICTTSLRMSETCMTVAHHSNFSFFFCVLAPLLSCFPFSSSYFSFYWLCIWLCLVWNRLKNLWFLSFLHHYYCQFWTMASGETVRVIVRCRPMNQRETDLKCQVKLAINYW